MGEQGCGGVSDKIDGGAGAGGGDAAGRTLAGAGRGHIRVLCEELRHARGGPEVHGEAAGIV